MIARRTTHDRYAAGDRYARQVRDRKRAGGIRRRPIINDDYRKGQAQ